MELIEGFLQSKGTVFGKRIGLAKPTTHFSSGGSSFHAHDHTLISPVSTLSLMSPILTTLASATIVTPPTTTANIIILTGGSGSSSVSSSDGDNS